MFEETLWKLFQHLVTKWKFIAKAWKKWKKSDKTVKLSPHYVKLRKTFHENFSNKNLFFFLPLSLHFLFIISYFHPVGNLQALHNSHSTLDRTCSDSVVSLKHRKSTSDLTSEEHRKENENSSSAAPSKHRRRGSSKGLAYLVEKRDSRRGSRESVMSTMSQQTNFSNEDIGPLTSFQQTQRGRQRRTSNFLELPGEFLWLIYNVCVINYLN